MSFLILTSAQKWWCAADLGTVFKQIHTLPALQHFADNTGSITITRLPFPDKASNSAKAVSTYRNGRLRVVCRAVLAFWYWDEHLGQVIMAK